MPFRLLAEMSTMEIETIFISIITLDAEVGEGNKSEFYFFKFYSLHHGPSPILTPGFIIVRLCVYPPRCRQALRCRRVMCTGVSFSLSHHATIRYKRGDVSGARPSGDRVVVPELTALSLPVFSGGQCRTGTHSVDAARVFPRTKC